MSREPMPFDHRPDPALGAALRQALTADDDPGFAARVLARAARAPDAPWDVLASWARAGITAAAAAALAAGFLLGPARSVPTSLDDVLVTATGPSARALVTSPRPPDPSVVLAFAEDR